MTRVLVTGGTGVLGRQVAGWLRGAADVRVLSRKGNPAGGTEVVRGDLETGAGLAAALAGVGVVVHCASPADYRRPHRDVEATRTLLDAARAHTAGAPPHIVDISIVGADRIPFGYYRAKLDAERLVEASGLPWTILWTTQFHDLVLAFLTLFARSPAVAVPRGTRVQPVDTGDVAARLAGLALGAPAGRVADLGGPQVLAAEELPRTYLAATGHRKAVLPVPLPGKLGRGFRAGGHLLADGDRGRRTFEDYLRSRVRPDGTVASPYDLKARRRAMFRPPAGGAPRPAGEQPQ